MNKNFIINKYMLVYEIKNTLNNAASFFFGVIFPTLLNILISISVTKDMPDNIKADVTTVIFVGISIIIPLCIMLISYATAFSVEVENNIPLRLKLFGISDKKLVITKLLTHYLYFTASMIIYFAANILILGKNIIAPSVTGFIIYIIILYIFAAACLVMAHGIAILLQKSGITYGVTMGLYFAIMILSGVMGIKPSQMPAAIEKISMTLPTYYIVSEKFLKLWKGEAYNIMPLIQAMIFFTAVSLIVLCLGFYFRKRRDK